MKVTVEKHKKGWAVVKQVTSGYLIGMKTVVSINKTKKEAEEATCQKS